MRKRLLKWAAAGIGLALLVPTLLVLLVDFPEDLLRPEHTESRRLYDRHGRLLREALSDAEGRGAWRGIEVISPWVGKAFVAVEDRRFEAHSGVDLRGIARALRDNLRAGRIVAGGSTITQQVVKLVRRRPRSLLGKAAEALDALRLERLRPKPAILEQYLNRAPFGNGAIGIEAAARLYLGTSAQHLGPAQAALLAGIPKAPSINNPFVDPERARTRQRRVLDAMLETGSLSAEAHAEALAEPTPIQARDARFAAPHFATWALAQSPPGDVHTTLDLGLQREVQRLCAEAVFELREQGVSQAAALVLSNEGEVLAWVGSVDFFDPTEGQVDMVTGLRQPGSTLKPFVYGLALEGDFTAATQVPDLPLFFPTSLGDYRPRNYDRRFHGWVSLRAALANSYNVPAVWIANRVGLPAVLARLEAVGFASLGREAEHYGLGLALGNGEVRLLELVNAYRVLQSGGTFDPIRWRRGRSAEPARRVMKAEVAHLLGDILADPVARAPAFGRRNVLELPFEAAAKTGTSTDFTDNWTVGYSTEVVVGVWVGNFDGRPMEGVSGVSGAGPLWNRIMRAAAHAPGQLPRAGLKRHRLCAATGGPWSADCDHGRDEWFLAGTAPKPPSEAVKPLRVLFPDDGDVFSLDPDTPAQFSRLKLRAQAPEGVERLVFELNGQVVARAEAPFEPWWALAPGRHQLRVWPEADPSRASRKVAFEVLR